MKRFSFAGLVLILALFGRALWGADHLPATPTTEKERCEVFLSFYRRILVDAYLAHGDRNAKWDLQTEIFLEEWARHLSSAHGFLNAVAMERLGQGAQEAGCHDPLLRLGLTCVRFSQTRHLNPDLFEIADLLMKRGDHPILIAKAASLATSYYDPAHQQVKSKSLASHSKAVATLMEQCARLLDPEFVHPGEERAAGRIAYNLIRDPDTQVWADYDDQLEQSITDCKIDPWVAHMIAAAYYYHQAWSSRGGGYADTVTEDGWKVFREKMPHMGEHLREAYRLHPEFPEAAQEMLDLTGAGFGLPNESKQLWFDRAITAQLDLQEAYLKYMHYSLPKLGGTYGLVYKIGQTGLETKRFDTWAPFQLHIAIRMVAHNETPNAFVVWNRILNKDSGPYERMLTGYEASEEMANKLPLFQTYHIGMHYYRGEYDKACAIHKQMKGFKDDALQEMSLVPGTVLPAIHALGGSTGEIVAKAQKQLDEKQWDEAAQSLKQATAACADDRLALTHLRRMEASRELLSKLKGHDWVPLPFDEDQTCWENLGGEWKRVDDHTIKGIAHEQMIRTVLRTPIGHRFEYRGQVTPIKQGFSLDNGGPLFCRRKLPNYQSRYLYLQPDDQFFQLVSDSDELTPKTNKAIQTTRNKSWFGSGIANTGSTSTTLCSIRVSGWPTTRALARPRRLA